MCGIWTRGAWVLAKKESVFNSEGIAWAKTRRRKGKTLVGIEGKGLEWGLHGCAYVTTLVFCELCKARAFSPPHCRFWAHIFQNDRYVFSLITFTHACANIFTSTSLWTSIIAVFIISLEQCLWFHLSITWELSGRWNSLQIKKNIFSNYLFHVTKFCLK